MSHNMKITNQLKLIAEIIALVFLVFNKFVLINILVILIVILNSSYITFYLGNTLNDYFFMEYKIIDFSHLITILICFIVIVLYENIQNHQINYMEGEEEFNKVIMDNYNKNIEEKLSESQILKETNRVSDLFKCFEIIKMIRKNKL